jgi:hypothetical protein
MSVFRAKRIVWRASSAFSLNLHFHAILTRVGNN